MIQTPLRPVVLKENESYSCQHMATKFAPPAFVHTPQMRNRLLTLLQYGLLHPLTLLSAPAGFGKTTLLLQWVQVLTNEHIPAVWISLDENDNEPLCFWNVILTALAQKLPAFDSLAKRREVKSVPDLLTLLINICVRQQEPIVLMLDDYHIMTDSTLQGQVAYFIERLPAHVHIVLSTRIEPRLPLARLRARNQIVEIHTDALRFTVEEATRFLRTEMQLSLTETEMLYLVQHVDGWIAALRLAGYALCEQGTAKDIYIAARRSQRYLQNYIVDEILFSQEDAVQTFLLRTALLSRFSASLCDAILDQHNSWQILQYMERANLFSTLEDDDWYSYQPLFAEALRCHLKRIEARETIALLHRRASSWYEEHAFLADAVEHLCELHDWEHAADVLERIIPSKHEGQASLVVLQNLLTRLPESLVQSRPLLRDFTSIEKPKTLPPSTLQKRHADETVHVQHTCSSQQLLDPLSEREIEVLQLVARGAQNGEIADELVIAIGTVKRHVSNILSKLGATNRTQAVAQARQLSIL